ncbi:hypothetical protein WYO_0197 [Methylobacterium sp. GXF4]|jgi:hypothetical protein|nr:hypothetical protein WYO_0197 [Methylobacterium sp. GXF4]
MSDPLVLVALLGPLAVLGLLVLLVQMVRWDRRVLLAQKAILGPPARRD